jgi:hypothetical protein
VDREIAIATLNDLIEASKDGGEGLPPCADEAKNLQLKPFFVHMARRTAAACRAANREVKANHDRVRDMRNAMA